MSNFVTLTELGKDYGVAARTIGAWLKGLCLRHENGWPSYEAIRDGVVLERQTEWGSSWLWNREKVCEVLDGMRYPRAGSGSLFPHVEEHEWFTIIRSPK